MLIVVTEGAPTACHHMDVTNVVQSPEQRGGGLAKARARHTRIASDRGHAHGVIRMTCEAVLSGGAADLDVDAAIRHGLQDAAVAILRCLRARVASVRLGMRHIRRPSMPARAAASGHVELGREGERAPPDNTDSTGDGAAISDCT